MSTKESQITYFEYLEGLYRTRLISVRAKGKYYENTRYEVAKEHEGIQARKLEKAINGGEPDADFMEQVAGAGRGRGLQYFNPYRIIPSQIATLKAIEAFRLRKAEMHMFTIIEGTHETNNINFQLNMETIRRKFHHGMRGGNYILMLEMAYFKNVAHAGGELIAPHGQGIRWGKLSRDEKERIGRKFSGGRNGAEGFRAKKVTDLVGAVSYMHKLPVYGYMLRPKHSYKHTTEYLKNSRLYFLYDQLRNYRFEDFLIAGGEGEQVRDAIIRHLKYG